MKTVTWLWLPLMLMLASCNGKEGPKMPAPAPESKAAPAQVAPEAPAPEAPPADPAASADKARAEEVAAAAAPAKEDDREAARLAEAAKAPTPAAEGRLELASKGDQRFYLDEFQAYVDTIPAYQQGEYSSFAARRELLKTWMLQELVAAKATEAGFDKDPRVQAAFKNALVKIYLSDNFNEDKLPGVSMKEIADRFESEKARYSTPEKVRAAHIMVRDRKKAEAILDEARKALAKPGIRPKREFAELARKHSQDPGTAQRGGDLLYFAEDGLLGSGETLDKELVSAAFGLKEVYDLSSVVRSSKGYHVVMLLARRPGENRTLEDAREELRIVLAREKLQKERDAFLEGVMKFEDWTVNSAALGDLKLTEVGDAPSAIKARANSAQAPDKPSTEEGEDQ